MTRDAMIEKLAEIERNADHSRYCGGWSGPENEEWFEGPCDCWRSKVVELIAATLSRPAPPDDLALRHAWEAGFRLCRSYGDNHHHFDGEQKERKWRDYIEGLAAPAPVAAPDDETPPEGVVETAVRQANYSPCQSKRGVVVFTLGPSRVNILSRGYNRKPIGFECDGSDACKATCRTEAVHAEQDALIGARVSLSGADLVHVKAVNGALVPSGGPSCVACSKLMVEAGIAGVWLFHESGWMRYQMSDFHRLSLKPASPVAAPAPETPAGYHPAEFRTETGIDWSLTHERCPKCGDTDKLGGIMALGHEDGSRWCLKCDVRLEAFAPETPAPDAMPCPACKGSGTLRVEKWNADVPCGFCGGWRQEAQP